LCSAQRVVHFVCQDPCQHMRHSNDIDDAMNDAIMVVDHQQKIKVFLYDIRSRYLRFVPGVQAGYDTYIRGAPSLYNVRT